jgi:hypothetical protein
MFVIISDENSVFIYFTISNVKESIIKSLVFKEDYNILQQWNNTILKRMMKKES